MTYIHEIIISLAGIITLLTGESINFGPVQFYKSVSNPNTLLSLETTSLIHCSTECMSMPGCTSFEYNCQALVGQTAGECRLLSNTVAASVQLVTSQRCFVQILTNMTPLSLITPPAMTPTFTTTTSTAAASTTRTSSAEAASTTASSIPTIKGLLNLPAMGGSDTYGLLTTDGWYFYDYDNLFSAGYRSGPYPLYAVIGDYSDLPEKEEVDCIMNDYINSRIELFSVPSLPDGITGLQITVNVNYTCPSDGRVYLWNDTLEAITSTSIAVGTWLGSDAIMALTSPDVKWCVYRAGVANERYFAMASNNLFVASDIETDVSVSMQDPVDVNGIDVNIFKSFPDDVLAVTNRHSATTNSFVVIFGNFSVYVYNYNQGTEQGSFTYEGQLNL